jgi:hypothetical protein
VSRINTSSGSHSGDDSSDSASGSPLTDSRLFDDGLQQVHHEITSQLATVEREGEQVKQVVGYALIGSRADPVTCQDLQQQLAELLGELHNSHDGVTLDDIALALWAELTRVSEMALPDDDGENEDEPNDSDTDTDTDADHTDSADADQRSDDSDTGNEGLGELFGSTDNDDTTDNGTPDRAFQ